MSPQSLGDGTVQVCLPILFAGECVEYAEGSGRQSQGEPDRRARFLICQRKGARKECRYGLLLSRLRFESDEQRFFDHPAFRREYVLA